MRPGSRKGAWSACDVVTSHDSTGARILLHLPSGTYLRLDESAARIVDLLNEDPDPDHVAAKLAARFDIPVERALGDVHMVIAAVHGQPASRTHRGGSLRRPAWPRAPGVGSANRLRADGRSCEPLWS